MFLSTDLYCKYFNSTSYPLWNSKFLYDYNLLY